MEPTRDDGDALVDLVDVLLREGVLVQADIVVSVAEVPLVGISLRAAVAGMTEMTDRGLLDGWDRELRRRARARARDRRVDCDDDAGPKGVPPEPSRRTGDERGAHTDDGSATAPVARDRGRDRGRGRSPAARATGRTAAGGDRGDDPDS
jgi:hypothetical protein